MTPDVPRVSENRNFSEIYVLSQKTEIDTEIDKAISGVSMDLMTY